MTRIDTGLAPLEIRPYQRRLSHSQVSTLHPDNRWSCPRQWAYGSLMKLKRAPSAQQCVGRMMDEAAIAFWLSRAEGKDLVASTMDAESAADAEARKCEWPSGDDGKRREAALDAVGGMCAFLVSSCQPPVSMGLQLSHEFSVRGSDGGLIVVTGRSDWVEPGDIYPERPAVIDLKTTGTRKWNTADVPDVDWLQRCKEQVTVYRLAIAATGLPDGTGITVEGPGAIVAVCVGPRRKEAVFARFDFEITKADADAMLARIVESDEVARADVHPARPGDACSFCPYVERCRYDQSRLASPDSQVAGRREG